MGFMKRKKQPHLFRNPEVDPTAEIQRAQDEQVALEGAIEGDEPLALEGRAFAVPSPESPTPESTDESTLHLPAPEKRKKKG